MENLLPGCTLAQEELWLETRTEREWDGNQRERSTEAVSAGAESLSEADWKDQEAAGKKEGGM